MDVLQIAIALLGALSVFLGYRLFCESPARFLSGALLTLFGAAILSADLVGMRSHGVIEPSPATHHTKPAGANRHRASGDRFV
jgi:hypothetical protein